MVCPPSNCLDMPRLFFTTGLGEMWGQLFYWNSKRYSIVGHIKNPATYEQLSAVHRWVKNIKIISYVCREEKAPWSALTNIYISLKSVIPCNIMVKQKFRTLTFVDFFWGGGITVTSRIMIAAVLIVCIISLSSCVVTALAYPSSSFYCFSQIVLPPTSWVAVSEISTIIDRTSSTKIRWIQSPTSQASRSLTE